MFKYTEGLYLVLGTEFRYTLYAGIFILVQQVGLNWVGLGVGLWGFWDLGVLGKGLTKFRQLNAIIE